MSAHRHEIQIYYEDTDHSGVVYHANYLKYFERAREHMLGVERLIQLLNDDGIGFVVYKASMKYLKGAVFGDRIEIRSTVKSESAYRLTFEQNAHLLGDNYPIVKAEIELACVDGNKKLVQIPTSVQEEMEKAGYSVK